jgi:hypothetical protein
MKPMGLVEPCSGEATAASKAWATLLKPCNISLHCCVNITLVVGFPVFMAYHGQSSTNLKILPKFAYYRCWTASARTVTCKKKWR